MSLVLHAQINKRGITQRIVIRDIRRSRTFPQQETHRDLTFKMLGNPHKALQREGLQNHLAIRVPRVHLAIHVERVAFRFRLRDNIHFQTIQFLVDNLLEPGRIQPRLLELDINSRAVSRVLRIIHVTERVLDHVGRTA